MPGPRHDSSSDFMEKARQSPASGQAFPLLLALIALAASLLITGWMVWEAAKREEAAARVDFDFRVREMAQRIGQRMSAYEQVLRGAQGLFAVSERVTRQEFRLYVSKLQLAQHYPGIEGLGFSQLVTTSARGIRACRT